VEHVLQSFEPPSWAEARSRIFFSAEASDHEFGDTLREAVTQSVSRVLVLSEEQEGKITWITSHLLATWGVARSALEAAARENLDRLLDDKSLEIEQIDGTKIGMVPLDSVFKASVIFAPRFKRLVGSVLEWPVLVVIPCRDFIYVLSEKDAGFLGRLGSTVQREYRESGYPITTEVIRVSDAGLEAIGKFPE
jgi:hypothetical protein